MDFKGQKLNPYNINGGKYYTLTDSISPSEMNSVVDGVVYSQNLGRKAEIFAELIERTIVDNEMTSSYDTRETADGRDILDQKTIVTQIQGETVRYENLIPFPYKDTNKTLSGITWTVNADGSVTANGTATENSTFTLIGGYIPIQGKYTFSGTIGGTNIYTDYALVGQFWSGSGSFQGDLVTSARSEGGNSVVINIEDKNSYGYINMYAVIIKGYTANNVTFYPMLNKGETALPYQPYFTGLKHAYFKGIKSTGRNLIPNTYYKNSGTINGITYTVNKDGSITLKGTATSSSIFFLLNKTWGSTPKLKAGTYTFKDYSEKYHNYNQWYWRIYTYNNGGEGIIGVYSNEPTTFTLDNDRRITVDLLVPSGSSVDLTVNCMLTHGKQSYDYEPYISEDYGLSEAVELGKWDNINPQTGKLTKATKTVTITSDMQALPYYNYQGWGVYVKGLVENEIHGDPEYISSSSIVDKFHISDKEIYILGALDKLGLTSDFPPYYDLQDRPSDFVTPTDEQWSTAINKFYEWLETNPITLEYEDKENATETYINLSDGYTAWSHGSETTNQGTIDNSQYGAMFKITQSYLEEIGK